MTSNESAPMRTLLIGATGYLGAAISDELLAKQAQVVLLARKPRRLEKLAIELEERHEGAEPLLYPLDMGGASPADYEDMAARIKEHLGGLDAVVFSAAAFQGLRVLANTSPLELLADIHVGLSAPVLMIQALLPLLLASKGQVLVVQNSTERCGKAYWGGYGIAQHGLRGVVSIFKQELEQSGVRVHGFEAPMLRGGVHRRAYMSDDPTRLTPADMVAKEVVSLLLRHH